MMYFRPAATALVAMILVACTRGKEGDTDTAAAAESAAGMAAMPGHDMISNRPAAKDADHEFLRMMSDHHEGLIEMATTAMTKATRPETQGDAHGLHTKQEEEQKRMLSMIQSQYNETVTPMVLPSNKAMIDSLASRTGAEYDRTFYRNVVTHHREGVRMIDDFLPRLSRAEVRQLAERMKADQQKEIVEFESKARA